MHNTASRSQLNKYATHRHKNTETNGIRMRPTKVVALAKEGCNREAKRLHGQAASFPDCCSSHIAHSDECELSHCNDCDYAQLHVTVNEQIVSISESAQAIRMAANVLIGTTIEATFVFKFETRERVAYACVCVRLAKQVRACVSLCV